jgi:hypothetical protein
MFRCSLRSGKRTHAFLAVALFFLGFAGASVTARVDAGIPNTPARREGIRFQSQCRLAGTNH